MAKLQKLKFLDEQGREIPDPRPLEVPIGYKKPETLADQIRRLIRSQQLADLANSQDMDTFEESEDFEIDDEMFDPSSPYEEVFDPVLGRGITLEEFRQNEPIYRRRFIEAENKAYEAMERSAALRARPKPAKPSGAGEAGTREVAEDEEET